MESLDEFVWTYIEDTWLYCIAPRLPTFVATSLLRHLPLGPLVRHVDLAVEPPLARVPLPVAPLGSSFEPAARPADRGLGQHPSPADPGTRPQAQERESPPRLVHPSGPRENPEEPRQPRQHITRVAKWRGRSGHVAIQVDNAECEWLCEYDSQGVEEAGRHCQQKLPEKIEEREGHHKWSLT